MGKRFATRFVYIVREMRSFIAYCSEPDTLLRSLKTALVVGTILGLINHGSELLSGQFAWNWVIPALVTYLIPFAVATYGQAQGTIHFKEDVLRVKRSRFRSVILSAAKDLCPARDPKLALRACARREAKG